MRDRERRDGLPPIHLREECAEVWQGRFVGEAWQAVTPDDAVEFCLRLACRGGAVENRACPSPSQRSGRTFISDWICDGNLREKVRSHNATSRVANVCDERAHVNIEQHGGGGGYTPDFVCKDSQYQFPH